MEVSFGTSSESEGEADPLGRPAVREKVKERDADHKDRRETRRRSDRDAR